MDQMNQSVEQSLGVKRKRTPIADSAPSLANVANGTVTPQINYLVKARQEKLGIIEGDAETFSEVLGMIDDYESMSLLMTDRAPFS